MSLHDIFASVTGNESIDGAVEGQIEATVEAVVEAQVAAEIAEAGEAVAEAEADIKEAEVAIEALEEKVEELEEVVEGMESMLSGATPFNAALFHSQYQRAAKISSKFGQPAEVHGVESFADASTASLNALAGVESFKETAAKGVAAVKKFFVDLYNGFINFFVGIFNKFKGIENRAKSLQSKIGSKEKLAEKPMLSKSAGWLNDKGELPGNLSGAVSAGVEKAMEAARGKGKALDNLSSAAEGFKKLGTASVTSQTNDSATFKVAVNKGSFTVVVPKTDAGLALTAINVAGLEGGEKKEGTPKSKNELEAICRAVQSNAKQMQNAKLDRKAMEANRDQTIAMLERDSAQLNVENKGIIATTKNATKGGLKLQSGMLKLAGVLLTAQLDFVSAHV